MRDARAVYNNVYRKDTFYVTKKKKFKANTINFIRSREHSSTSSVTPKSEKREKQKYANYYNRVRGLQNFISFIYRKYAREHNCRAF